MPDPEDTHEVQRYQEEDNLERGFGQGDARISQEVGKLKVDIDSMNSKLSDLSTFIKKMPINPGKPWDLKARTKKWTTPTQPCEKDAVFWVVARNGRFDPWAPYAIRVIGIAQVSGKMAFQGAILEEGERAGPLVEGGGEDLWDEVEARNFVLEPGE